MPTKVGNLEIPDGISLDVTRNGKTITLQPFTFGKKSPHSGKTFLGPLFTTDNLQEMLEWAGISDFVDSANRSYRKTFQDIFLDCLDDNTPKDGPDAGKTNWDAFWKQIVSDWQDFTAGVVKLSTLEEDIAELVDEQQALIATTPDSEEDVAAMMSKLKDLAAQIKPLKAKKEEISARYAERAAKRKAKKEAEEAAKKSAQPQQAAQ